MNKHTRLIVSVLFIGIIVLAVAITRFYSRTEKSAVSSGSQTVIEKKLGSDSAGNRAFQNSEGLVGIIDSSEHVIVSPEWQTIRFTSNSDCCIASKRIQNQELYGCIDYAGNIVVPFVYSDIKQASSAERVLYIAQTYDKQSSVVYNSSFTPCFSRAWDSCKYNNGELTVASGSDTYTYTVKNSDFLFKKAVIQGTCKNHPFSVDVEAPGLTIPMMEKIRDTVAQYINYAYARSNKDAERLLSEMDIASREDFHTLFPNEKKITAKILLDLQDIVVTSSKSRSDNKTHYNVSLTARTKIIYRNEVNYPTHLIDNYKANIEFTGSSEEDFKAISGKFLAEKPNYPETQSETQPETQQTAAEQEN